MRSNEIKKGFEHAPHRSLLRATGVIQNERDFEKPFIAKHISDMIMTIESIINIDSMFDMMEERLGDSSQ